MTWGLLLLFVLLTAPVRLGIKIQWEKGVLHGTLGGMVWGIRARIPFAVSRSPAGQLALCAFFRGRRLALPAQKIDAKGVVRRLLVMRKGGKSGKKLLKLVRLQALSVDLRAGGLDAGRLALTVGLLRLASGFIPSLRFRCAPVLGGAWGLRGGCIAETRLGILLAAALIGYANSRRAKEEKKQPWIVPSET